MVPLVSPVCLARRTPFPKRPARAQAGGRPNTIDINNWKQYLKADGTPSARLIVEGANLFITQQAQPQAPSLLQRTSRGAARCTLLLVIAVAVV